MKWRIFFLFFSFLLSCSIFAQKETWNWTFGGGAGLTWRPDQLRSFTATGLNGTANITLNNLPGTFASRINQLEGVFSMSDSEGELLFYSDGVAIWKGDHTATPITSLLGGHRSSAQSGIVIPYPGTLNRYIVIGLGYMFADNMGYMVVEANSPSNVSIVRNRTAFSGHLGLLGESMTAIRHSNGIHWWIIAPGRANSSLIYMNAWALVPSWGVQFGTPEVTPTSINYSSINGSQGYIKFTANGKHFVWGTWMGGRLVYGDFDNNTGRFSNIRSIDNHGAYGVEFSLDQKYLYTTINTSTESSTNTGLYIWDFDALLSGSTSSYKEFIPNSSLYPTWSRGPGGLQIDCVGRIWMVSESNTEKNIILIDNPNEPDDLKIYLLQNFVDGVAKLGLPSFSASWWNIDIGEIETGPVLPVCKGTEITFSVNLSSSNLSLVESIEWNFGDGTIIDDPNVSAAISRKYIYAKRGTYILTLTPKKLGGEVITEAVKTLSVKINSCQLPVNHNISVMGYYD
jgi:hypothetical protein